MSLDTAGGGMPLFLRLDREASAPLYQQVYTGLRDAILEGRLTPGTRLPATRTLAEELGVSRMTVLDAYDRLTLEGFLDARVGAGTWVSEQIDPALLPGDSAESRPRSLSGRGDDITVLEGPTPRPYPEPTPFQLGIPALDEFPLESWARIAGRAWRDATHAQLGYGGNTGYAPLREAVALHLRTSRGLGCTASQVIVVEGTQQGLDLSARVLLDRGDRCWMEEPGYGGARGAVVSAGGAPVPIPVDREGLRVDAGRRRAPDARLAYVCPSHQFPLGVVMSLSRRLALLSWAEERDAWILEDDYDSEYRYGGQPLMSLQGLDTSGRVLYLGSFSKTLFPSLRLGYVVVPPDLVDTFAKARAYTGQHAPTVNQALLADFMENGDFVRHVRRMRGIYEDRRDTLLEALDRELGAAVEVGPADSGLHVTVRFRSPVDDVAISDRARDAGVEALPLSRFYDGVPGATGLVLGYGAAPPTATPPAAEILARTVEAAG